uniref:Cadherin domain-containing protein n=1 Tax=Setaria digitata TaxID=48799 RepID=A0A915PM28_9BILA
MDVEANDSCGNETNIHYSLSKVGSVKEPFRIDEQSGKICLDSILDYEQCTIYQLHVYAHDANGRSSRALVNVHVEDVNDNAPVFHPDQYNVSVREDIEIGHLLVLVSANDADSGINGKVHYRFATEESDIFRLEAKSGGLHVQNKFSRKNYNLRIEAIDGKGLISEKKAAVHINIINSSINVPQFTNTLYKFDVLEETLPGIEIGQVEAEGPFPISYKIYSGDPDHFFSIDAKSGQIGVAQYLDADKWEQLLINIEASMMDNAINHTQVIIKLIDTNDNDPVFEMDKVESFIYENHPVHQPFFAVQAYDKDRGKNGEVIYSLLQSKPECPVSIQPLTGELTLRDILDFESINTYHLVIEARDQGVPSRSSNITVILNVLDVNDNRPEFSEQLYSAEISEDIQLMTDILTVQAKDLDSEENGKISYQLSEANHDFGIHKVAGNIFVKAALDRERIAEYHLHVIASDHGKPELSSQTIVHIKILDINDNSPSCPTRNSFIITDNTDIDEAFDRIIATDSDDGINGSLVYRLQVDDVNFAIRHDGELIVKKKLSQRDYRKESRLTVIVQDRNGDSQARSTICPIRITAEKMDSKVKFLEPVDRVINKLTSPLDISNNFEIWNNTLRTSSHFNVTTIKNSHTLTVIAADNDGREKQITFAIRFSDLEVPYPDNKAIVIRISKTAPVGSQLMTLGNGKDSGIFWHLENETDVFYLDSITSVLYLTRSFRWIDDKSYLLKVRKWNQSDYDQAEQHSIYIEVEPTDIHWPRFYDCPKFFTVKENEPTGSVIGKVYAKGADEGAARQLSYSIVRGSTDLFSIDPDSGDILLIRPLHWEQDLSLFLVVEAEDKYQDIIKHSHCVVIINIEDINDHEPKFLSSSTIIIDDDFVAGDIIHHVVAIDNDANDNAKITYTLCKDDMDDDTFDIHPNTGALVLKQLFSGERKLRIRANDNGKPAKYAEMDITVKTDSSHRRWKYFHQRNFSITLNSSTGPGTVVYDFFENRNGWPKLKLFSYFVSEDDILQLLDDGKLVLLREITPQNCDWLVIATKEDGLVDWATIHLNIIGFNQFPPRIAPSSCGNLTIRENISAKHLTRIYAWDQDQGSGGEIFYKIVAGNENSAFFLNSSTGLLSCRELDHEEQSHYFLVITAEDQGIPKRADTCTLWITVIDENDNVPIFNDNIPRLIEIDDSVRVGDILERYFSTILHPEIFFAFFVDRLSATDHDKGANGEIIYSIVSDNSGLLDVRTDTGEIVFARDHLTSYSEYTIKVRAEDRGISRVLASELDIQLRLVRSRPQSKLNEPQFLSAQYFGFINEGEQRGQFVLQVQSSDRLTEDAPLAYSIVSGNRDSAFDIDDNGRIVTAQELDHEIESYYILKVIGTGNVKITPETDVHIRVINTNDNVPSFPILKPRKVPESATYGTLIATVIATDVDADTQLQYSILSSGDNDLFEIDPFTGKIFLVKNLDYETNKEHIIHVQVTDGENTSGAKLQIIVEDVNDNAPQFEEQFYLINIERDIELDSKIARIRANDRDTGAAGAVHYELAMNNMMTNFRIDHKTGDLSVAAKLKDRTTYYLKVYAFDGGKPQLSSVVVVQINIGNENYDRKSIHFTKTSFSFTIPENTLPFTEFGKLTLMDDLPTDILLRIQDSEVAKIFGISRNGSLFLKYSIDADFRNKFQFHVIASSLHAAYNASVKVDVSVTDLNDNAPYFIDKINEITISEATAANDVLARFAATDIDSGDNGRVSYQLLSGNDREMFGLNTSSGVLYLARNVNIEEIDDIIDKFNHLLIAAIDNGTPARWNWTSVLIHFNFDSSSATAPFFVVSQYETSVFENLPKGSIVFRSTAVNKFGLHGDDWIYTLINNTEVFACSRNTGHIILVKSLDFETESEYEFMLNVKDGKNRSATVAIHIRILGIDEYPPVFRKTNYIFQIPRNLQIGESIGVIEATDEDLGVDGVIQYEMRGNAARYLRVNPTTGQIVLSHELPYRTTSNVTYDEFVIFASSSAKQSSRTKVIVQIGDFSPLDVLSVPKTFMITQILTVGSLLLLFVLLITLILLVYSVSRGNIAVVNDLNRSSSDFEQERQLTPFPSSPYNPSSPLNRLINTSTKCLPKPLLETQVGNHSVTHSMPDSGIDPDELSVASSVTDYLNQVGVTPNKYFDSNQSSSREPTGYKDDMHNDPEINDLIYAKVDEILSPASRMNACFTSNSSINISSFSANAVNSNPPVPTFRPLSELLLNMKKQRH